MSRAERLSLIERPAGSVSLVQQVQLLGLSRSGLYYQRLPPSAEEVALKHRIDELYTQYPFYGSRRITVLLQREMEVNRKRVQRCMREMGLAGVCPGPNTSKRAPQSQIYPYLLRHVKAVYPNHIWGVDITYIRLSGGWLYLVALLDWFSRYVVSWALSQTLEEDFVLEALDQALERAIPTICNSDQGSHFTSPQYLQRLREAQVQISMDGRGRAMDNLFTERLWRTLKYEEVYLHDYTSPREARRGLSAYLDFYNHRRPHQSLNYRTPAEVYLANPATLVSPSLPERSRIA